MINLDERYHSYLHNDDKMFYIDGKRETVRGYEASNHLTEKKLMSITYTLTLIVLCTISAAKIVSIWKSNDRPRNDPSLEVPGRSIRATSE